MASEYFLGIELGTEALKAVVLDSSGQVCGEDTRGYPVMIPKEGWAEQEPGRWTRASVAATAGAIRRAGVQPDEITAIGMSSQVDGLVIIDSFGEPVRPAIIWSDRRAGAQCAKIIEKASVEEIVETTGLNVSPMHVLPKIMWVMEHEPAVYEKAKKFVTPGTYLLYFMTGEWATDWTTASCTMMFDIKKRGWAGELIRKFGISIPMLPPVVSPTLVIGEAMGDFAELTGLKNGTPVVAGSAAEYAAALGVGVTRPGLVCDIVSMVEPVFTVADNAFMDTSRLMETRAGFEKSSWFVGNPGFVSGGNYKWLADNFGALEKFETKDSSVRTAYDLLTEQAAKAPPGSDGVIFFPFLMGAMAPEWNPDARGMLAGFTLSQGRNHIIRAIIEGAAYALRDVVERMKECGLPVEEIRIVGGSSRSRLMEKVRADVTGVTISHPNSPETAAYGAAMLAAVGRGFFMDTKEAADAWVRMVHKHEPDPGNAKMYDDMYSKYRLVYDRLRNDFNTLWG